MPNLDYTNYDFDALVIQLQNLVKAKASWKDTYRSGTGQQLIEAFCYIENLVNYMINRRAEESTILTAKLKSSIVNLVKLINYLPKRQTSAIGYIRFTISAASSKIVYIPKYTECQTANGRKYTTNEESAINPGNTFVDVLSIQGELTEVNFVSDGTTDQEFNISDIDVENSADTNNPSLRILIDNEEWTPVTSFIESISSSKHYTVTQNTDDTITIRFGNGIKGAIPTSGETIIVKYIKTDGIDGNVYNTDNVTTLNNTIYNEDNEAVSNITVTNPGLFLGGDDAETAEEIAYEAPRVFATGDRAVTKDDFMAILDNYPGVADSNVWGELEEAEAAGEDADYESLNKVYISLVLQEWQLPDDNFEELVSIYIRNQSMLTVKYEFIAATILNIIPVIELIVTSGYSLAEGQSAVETELANQFLLGDTTKLGTMIKYSNVLQALDALASVSYLNMYFEIYKQLTSLYDSDTDFGATLEATNIVPGSVRIFVDDTQVSVDTDNGNGTGSFTTVLESDYTVTGTVNYTTGLIAIDIAEGVSDYIVSARYQQDEDRNIVTDFNEICKLYDTDFISVVRES